MSNSATVHPVVPLARLMLFLGWCPCPSTLHSACSTLINHQRWQNFKYLHHWPGLPHPACRPGDYVNIPPFGADCVGQGQLVDVAGASAVPPDYDYNGLQGSITPEEPVEPTEPVASPSTAPVLPEDTAAPAPAPEERPADTPVAAPSPAPAESSPMPVPSPVPSPVPTPPSAVPLSAAASSLLAAALAVLAAAVLA